MIDHRTAIYRRQLLASAGAVAVAGVAGCTTFANWVANDALEDVNIFNEGDGGVRGTIEIVSPDTEIVLSETFDLPAAKDTEDGEHVATYSEVWNDAGTYEASVALEEETEERGESKAAEPVVIDDPDSDMLTVPLGDGDYGDRIVFTVARNWSEFG